MNTPEDNGLPPLLQPVPDEYRGAWQRTLLISEDGCDTTTTVYWLQTTFWHADLRLPADRPDFAGIDGLDDCTDAHLEWLRIQQGFAGITTIDTNAGPPLCTWHRIMDFQGPQSMPDAGTLAFEDGLLKETGVHAAYLEHWRFVSASSGSAAFRLQPDGAAADTGHIELLLQAGDRVMYVRPRCASLRHLRLDGWPGCDRPRKLAWLDFEISFGHRTGEEWEILHSTLPWMEGTVRPFLRPEDTSDNGATIRAGAVRLWRMLNGESGESP